MQKEDSCQYITERSNRDLDKIIVYDAPIILRLNTTSATCKKIAEPKVEYAEAVEKLFKFCEEAYITNG